MAKLERELSGEFDEVLNRIENGIISGSLSANLEDSSDFCDGDTRCSIRVFERYSAVGNNRVSLSVTLFQNSGSKIFISAITSGGSQGILFKINTLGEHAFLEKLDELI